MPPILRRFLHWSGSALAIAGIAFVILRLRGYSSEINYAGFAWTHWVAVAGLALLYALSNLLLALAWRNLLKHFGANTSPSWAVWGYGVSQIAKYVPGNIFHLASRQAVGMAAGVPGWALAKSALWELCLISSAGCLFVLLVLPFYAPGLNVSVSVGIFAVVFTTIIVGLWHFLGPLVAQAYGWQASFLAISGMLFLSLVELLSVDTVNAAPWSVLVGAFVLAWLAGLVTPGAPAGVGVRELVLLFLLKGMTDEANLLLAVVLGRLVTVVGDLVFFASTALIRHRQ